MTRTDHRRITLLIIILVCVLRAPTLLESMYLIDEAYYATIADDLLSGGVVYRTAVDTHTPFLYYIYEGVFRVAGRNNLRAVHLLAMLVVMATALGVWRIGSLIVDERAGAWGGIGYAAFVHAYLPRDTLAANSEIFAALPLTVSIVCFLLGERRNRPVWLIASGVLCGIATCIRQPSAVNLAVMIGYLGYAWGIAHAIRLRHAIISSLFIVAGFVAVIVAMVLYYQAQGNWTEVYQWSWAFAVRYVGSETTVPYVLRRLIRVHATFILAGGLLWYFGVKQAVAIIRRQGMRRTGCPDPMLLVLWFVLTYPTIFIGWRFPGHYHLSVLPSLSVLAGLSFTPFLTRLWRVEHPRARRVRRLIAGAAALPTVGFLVMAFIVREQTLEYKPLVQWIVARTRPDDRIFVWGSYPQLYCFSDRRLATRFVSCTHLTGMYASRPRQGIDTSKSVIPGSWDMLAADLAAHPPKLIIDMSTADSDWRAYPMTQYSTLREYLAGYRLEGRVSGATIYRRVI